MMAFCPRWKKGKKMTLEVWAHTGHANYDATIEENVRANNNKQSAGLEA